MLIEYTCKNNIESIIKDIENGTANLEEHDLIEE